MSAGQVMTGSSSSVTVTVAVQVLLLPLTSVTVRVTVFAPRSEQSKLVWLAEIEAMPQLSLLPPSMSSLLMTALPLASQ